ncbi:MAG: hypothetical protein IJ323_05160 [Clostridia bacterium]|nr:hypothetical protein [Clostridia bacterium]MBQ7897797.1 hypothetical protein [Clostridia bacterium]
MWKLSDTVVYGSAGVCKIEDIREELFADEKRTYFILKPLFDDKTTIHVPSFNEKLMSKIKPVLKKAEALSLIKSIPAIEPLWIDGDKLRQEKYKEVLDSGDRTLLVSVIKALYERRLQLTEKGKKMRASDEYAFKDAEQLFENECAHIFALPREEVRGFIISNMENAEA